MTWQERLAKECTDEDYSAFLDKLDEHSTDDSDVVLSSVSDRQVFGGVRTEGVTV